MLNTKIWNPVFSPTDMPNMDPLPGSEGLGKDEAMHEVNAEIVAGFNLMREQLATAEGLASKMVDLLSGFADLAETAVNAIQKYQAQQAVTATTIPGTSGLTGKADKLISHLTDIKNVVTLAQAALL